MTHRERILTALRRQCPDRLPIDLGSTIATTMTAKAHERLRTHLGLPSDPPPICLSLRASTVVPDEAILRHLDVDARPLVLGSPRERPDRPVAADAFIDEWGVTWRKPAGGHYINVDGPFYRCDDPTPPEIEKHSWPDPHDPGRFEGLRARAKELHAASAYAVVLNTPVGPVHLCQFVRGYGAWLEDLLVHPAFAEALIERVTEIWIGIVTRALEEAGDYVDVVMFGDDIGIQKSTLVRPELYRRMIKPRHKRIVEAIKRFQKPVLYHSCGAVYALIPDLIEVGIDALNPVQVSAAGMDTARLKREFGSHLAFWGGVDTQRILPTGAPEQVREEVRRRIDDLAGGGGYVLCAVHNIQPEVPPENVEAMYRAALEYGGQRWRIHN